MSQMYVLAFCWGFAEATVFFIVPDVYLSFIALHSLRLSLNASVYSLTGAILGGSLMHYFGRSAPDAARTLLARIPAISPLLIHEVALKIETVGIGAIVMGPLGGIPYKIYAVEWGALGRSFVRFLFVSIPARYPRFLVIVMATAALRRYITAELLAVVWLAFYAFYFSKFRASGKESTR